MSDESMTTDEAQERAARAAELAAEAGALFGSGQGQIPDGEAADGEAETDTDELGGVPVVAVVQDEVDPTDPRAEDESQEEAEQEGGDGEEDAEGEQGSEDEPVPALPSFGLVFQAPDLSEVPRRRSRRATSAASTPPERPVEEAQDPAGVPEEEADVSDSRDDGEDGGSRGRRRRRGGKGRKARVASEEGEQVEDQPQRSGDEAGSGDEQDATGGEDGGSPRGGRGRGRRGRGSGGQAQGSDQEQTQDDDADEAGPEAGDGDQDDSASTRRRRRRSRSGQQERSAKDEVTSVKGSTRLEAKRQRRREGREAGRRRTIITEAEFLARRESVERVMVVRGLEDRTQIAVLEDGVPVEHYVSRSAQTTMVGNVYLGRVQNVLPSMEAAFVDIGKGRNAVLYAGEVNWDAAGLVGNEPRRIENALKSGESVLVQVTKDPIGHKGARLTSQVSLPGRFLVYVPGSTMTGISRKLPENERTRLKKILKEVVPADVGVIVRTAAEGAAEGELRADVERLTRAWERIQSKTGPANAPALLHGEPDMTVRVIRDVFNEDFAKLVVSGDQAWKEVSRYIDDVAPDLADRVEKYTGTADVFTVHRVHEAIAKAMDRKVWLPSGGSLVIDRTEAMTVVDVNTGKFTGSGGNLEETVTKNNIEAAEEIVRQLRLRDIGGIIVIDFIDMVLESNRDLVIRRLLECLGRDRTKHQVAEVTSLGLVQMTRKRVGSGLIEVFSETCAHCNGRGLTVHPEPAGKNGGSDDGGNGGTGSSKRGRGKGQSGRGSGGGGGNGGASMEGKNVLPAPNPNGPTPAQIAAAAHAAALNAGATSDAADAAAKAVAEEVVPEAVAQEPAEAVAAEATAAEASTSEEADAGHAPAEDAPVEKRTRRSSRRSSPSATARPRAEADAAPGTESEGSPEADQTAQGDALPQGDAAPEADASPQADTTPVAAAEPAPRRRRRGRVVAPAGPPTGE